MPMSLLFGCGAKDRVAFDFGEAAGKALAFRIDQGRGARALYLIAGRFLN
jgi:hypothetical protein